MAKELSIPNSLTSKFGEIEVRRQLMKDYGKHNGAYFGVNEDGENVELHIAEDSIVLRTYQENKWVRVNYYDSDGFMEGETFDGRWE